MTGVTIDGATVESSSAGTIVTSGLLLHLDAGNVSSYPGSGTTWTSLVGSYTATLGAGVGYNSGNGGSLTFNGGSVATATVASASALTSLLNNFTVEAWYSSNNISGYKPQIMATGSGSNGFVFGQYSTAPTGWKVTKYGVVDIYIGSIPQNTNWHQVVLTYSSTGGVTVYVDGVSSGTYNNNINLANPNITTLPIGKGEGLYHNGKMSIVRMYNTALTSTQVLQNFNANKSRFGL